MTVHRKDLQKKPASFWIAVQELIRDPALQCRRPALNLSKRSSSPRPGQFGALVLEIKTTSSPPVLLIPILNYEINYDEFLL